MHFLLADDDPPTRTLRTLARTFVRKPRSSC
jgi:hypothetical protein